MPHPRRPADLPPTVSDGINKKHAGRSEFLHVEVFRGAITADEFTELPGTVDLRKITPKVWAVHSWHPLKSPVANMTNGSNR